MTNIKKILIVGEKLSGKSSIIKTFKEYEPLGQINCDSVTDSTSNTTNAAIKFNFNQQQNIGPVSSAQPLTSASPPQNKAALTDFKNKPMQKQQSMQGVHADFSLKILTIEGQKVRVQLWDQASNMNPQTTFQPLYTRHVSGCIIVANTSNPKSLQRAHRWKEMFDKKTKVPDEPAVPATIFINHDVPLRDKDTINLSKIKEGEYVKIEEDDYVLSPERTFSDTEVDNDKDIQTSSPSFQPENINIRQQAPKAKSIIQQQKSSSPLIKSDKQLKNISSEFKSKVDHESQSFFEQQALTDQKGFFGVYHVSMGEPDSITDAFESFLTRIINEEYNLRRSSTTDSKFYHDDTIKSKKCICRQLIEGFESQEDDSFLQQNNNCYNNQGKNMRNQDETRDRMKHHPHCPMRLQQRTGYSSDENSFVLKAPRLNKRRFNKKRSIYELPPNQQGNSCC